MSYSADSKTHGHLHPTNSTLVANELDAGCRTDSTPAAELIGPSSDRSPHLCLILTFAGGPDLISRSGLPGIHAVAFIRDHFGLRRLTAASSRRSVKTARRQCQLERKIPSCATAASLPRLCRPRSG